MKDNSISPRRALLGRPRRLFNTLRSNRVGCFDGHGRYQHHHCGPRPGKLGADHRFGRRLPAFRMVKAYEKAHPSVKLDIVTCDAGANGAGSIESKVALSNRVGHGWPDIVFSARGKRRPKARASRRSISRPCSTREAPPERAPQELRRGYAGPVLYRRQARVPAQRPRLRRAVGQRRRS